MKIPANQIFSEGEQEADLKRIKTQEAKFTRDEAIKQPVNGFDYDPVNIMGAVLAFILDPALKEIKWRMADNTHQVKTKEEIMTAFSGFIAQTQAAYNAQAEDEK